MRCFTFALVYLKGRYINQISGQMEYLFRFWPVFWQKKDLSRKDIGQMILFSIDMSKQKRVFSFFQNMDTT